jgi:outer membrane protein assembly factor BamE (lipoprotein component of BamABCDE complex)
MWKRATLLIAAVLVVITLTGCLIIPTDYYTDYSRQNITEKPPETIIPGTTTREEVLQILGEPDNTSPDESELWYLAEKVKAWLIIGDRGGEIIRAYLLIIHFNRSGVVESKQVVALPIDKNPEYQSEPHFSKPAVILPDL